MLQTLYHTSPEPIGEIREYGSFGSFLFFAQRPYVTSICGHVTYTLDIDDNDVIDAGSMYYHEDLEKCDSIISDIATRFGIDEDTAIDLLCERKNIIDMDTDGDDLCEQSWWLQWQTAEAAKALGYRGVCVTDEQGAAWMIDMLGRESELTIEGN